MTDEELADIKVWVTAGLDRVIDAGKTDWDAAKAWHREYTEAFRHAATLMGEVERLRDLAAWLAQEAPDWRTGVRMHVEACNLLGREPETMLDEDR